MDYNRSTFGEELLNKLFDVNVELGINYEYDSDSDSENSKHPISKDSAINIKTEDVCEEADKKQLRELLMLYRGTTINTKNEDFCQEADEKLLRELLNEDVCEEEDEKQLRELLMLYRGDDLCTSKEIDPELTIHAEHYRASIKTEEEVQDIVDRYKNSEVHELSNTKILKEDIYANPTPGCSFHFIDSIRENHNTNPTPDCSYHLGDFEDNQYAKPTPGCSYNHDQNDNVLEGPIIVKTETISPHSWYAENNEVVNNFLPQETIKQEPDLNIDICSSSEVESEYEGQLNHLDVNMVLLPIQNKIKVELIENEEVEHLENEEVAHIETEEVMNVSMPIQSKIKIEDIETEEVMDVYKNVSVVNEIRVDSLEDGSAVCLENEITLNSNVESAYEKLKENSLVKTCGLVNLFLDNFIDDSVYRESLDNLTIFYGQIHGIKYIPADVTVQDYINFCIKILQIRCNHTSLVNEVTKGSLVKFKQLSVWGVNRHRDIEELMTDTIPDGYTRDEAEVFVLNMINKTRESISKKDKYFCLACDRRDDNLTWLIAHLVRGTSEIIYMCSFCGFLYFDNACSLIYHVILDELDGRRDQFCVECYQLYPSIVDHLMDTEGSWKECCTDCDFISLSECSHKIHQRYHSKEKYHVCPECGAFFLFFDHLKNHLKNVCFFNAKKVRYICPICAIIFRNQVLLFQHLYGYHHRRMLKCIQCHMLFPNRFEYCAHRDKEHPEFPCTYQISHTCALCPGIQFRSSLVQTHIQKHSYDVINAIILYACDCKFYTIHKQKFVKHKANSCKESHSFGKWDNDHEMKICNSCHDVKFVNISQPYDLICEDCEYKQNPTLDKVYQCKVCKHILSYCWDYVIEHFFIHHSNIPVNKHGTNVRMISLTDDKEVQVSLRKVLRKKSFDKQREIQISSLKVSQGCLNCENQSPVLLLPGTYSKSFTAIPKTSPINHTQPEQSTVKEVQIDGTEVCNNLPNVMFSSLKMLNNEKKTDNLKKPSQFSKNVMAIPKTLPINQTQQEQSNLTNVQVDGTKVCNSLPKFMFLSHKTLKNVEKKTDNSKENLSGDLSCIRVSKLDTASITISEGDKSLQEINKLSMTDSLSISNNFKQYESQNISFKFDQSSNILKRTLTCESNRNTKKMLSTNEFSHGHTDEMFCLPTINNDYFVHYKGSNNSLPNKINCIIKPLTDKKKISTINCDIDNLDPSVSIEQTLCEQNKDTEKTHLECKKCNFKCSEALLLIKHFIDVHRITNTYQCMECGNCFDNFKNKLKHLQRAHKINTKTYLEPDISRLDTEKSEFRCKVCLKGFSNNQEMNSHLRCHGMAFLQQESIEKKRRN